MWIAWFLSFGLSEHRGSTATRGSHVFGTRCFLVGSFASGVVKVLMAAELSVYEYNARAFGSSGGAICSSNVQIALSLSTMTLCSAWAQFTRLRAGVGRAGVLADAERVRRAGRDDVAGP